jgi:hypothetical protein
MTGEPANLRGATLHFLRTEGPRGFVVRFALVYATIALILQAVSLWVQAPVYEIYLRACLENECDFIPYMDELNAVSLQSNLTSLLMLPLSLAVWVVFEGASQRRYIRGEGFRLAIGADEGRLAIVALIWIALLFGGYLALVFGTVLPGLIIGLIGGAAAGAIVGGLIFLVGLVGALWLFARLSPASALTIRDRHIRFFEAWNLTRGNGWRLAGSYFLLLAGYVVLVSVSFVVLLLLGILLLAPAIDSSAGSETAPAILATMSQPYFWAPVLLMMFLVLTIQSVFSHAMGGPAAFIVRQSTARSGTAISETFV